MEQSCKCGPKAQERSLSWLYSWRWFDPWERNYPFISKWRNSSRKEKNTYRHVAVKGKKRIQAGNWIADVKFLETNEKKNHRNKEFHKGGKDQQIWM